MEKENLKDIEEKRLKEGWIKSWMMIEVLAITEEAAKTSLEKHIDRLEKDKGIDKKVIILKRDFKEIQKREKPLRNIEVAYSNVVELEILTQNFETLVYVVMNYAPSSVEIIKPEDYKLKMGEGQAILNSVSEMMHKYAAAGIGGVVISS